MHTDTLTPLLCDHLYHQVQLLPIDETAKCQSQPRFDSSDVTSAAWQRCVAALFICCELLGSYYGLQCSGLKAQAVPSFAGTAGHSDIHSLRAVATSGFQAVRWPATRNSSRPITVLATSKAQQKYPVADISGGAAMVPQSLRNCRFCY
jgi:hypothetical protein